MATAASKATSQKPTQASAATGGSNGTSDRAEAVKGAIDQARETVADLSGTAQERASDALARSREVAGTAQSELEETIRKHPLLAVAGAVGVGVLLGLAMRGRSY